MRKTENHCHRELLEGCPSDFENCGKRGSELGKNPGNLDTEDSVCRGSAGEHCVQDGEERQASILLSDTVLA